MNAALRVYVYPVANQALKRDLYMDNVYRVAPDVVPENVADCLTKGLSPSKLNSSSEWQDGPGWLGQLKSDWPIQQGRNNVSTDEIEREMPRYYKKTSSSSFLMKMNRSNGYNNSRDKLMHNSGTLQHLV